MTYKIPTMSDIGKLKSNQYNCISTFSGCGGSSLGYRMAGFNVLYANEFVKSAADSYQLNKKDHTFLDRRDIRDVKGSDILKKIGLKKGELDILDGSPPCASFSTAGARSSGWGEVKKYSDSSQRTDDLFFEYARLVKEIKPKVFIAENVSGLVKGVSKGYFKTILKKLRSCGYDVEVKVLNAKWLGVPQSRERVIFIGVRKDLNIKPSFPKPFKSFISIKEAFNSYKKLAIDVETDIKKYAIYKHAIKLGKGCSSKKYFSLVRPDLNKPCPTITATVGNRSAASVIHFNGARKFSVDELKILSSFPLDFKLEGSYEKRCERVGRAVPPLMMKAISENVKINILDKI